MKRTSDVLAMMKDGMRTQAMKLLHEALGNHDKRRCNEYLSLMYLMLLAGSSQDQIEQGMSTLAPAFKQQIQTINQTSRETARDSNHTATALSTLFKAWRTAVEADRKDMYNDRRVDHIQEFVARYQVQLEEDGCLKEVLSRELFVALKRVARDFGLRFEMDSSRQFAQRFANDLETIREAGFDVVISQKRYGTKLYTIQTVE
jgi:DNA primase